MLVCEGVCERVGGEAPTTTFCLASIAKQNPVQPWVLVLNELTAICIGSVYTGPKPLRMAFLETGLKHWLGDLKIYLDKE